MSNFDNFDMYKISPKLVQRWNFVCNFYCKKIYILGSLDNAKNAKGQLCFGHPIPKNRIPRTTYSSLHSFKSFHCSRSTLCICVQKRKQNTVRVSA